MHTWKSLLGEEKQKAYFQKTLNYIDERRQSGIRVFPPASEVFNAFKYTPFDAVKVVILGQDPYHGLNQAHGLSFSVKPGIKIPPSLLNIFKALESDIADFKRPNHGCLNEWATQGVLLLNTVLTVEAGQAHSHKHLGWESFTDVVIHHLNHQHENIVFLLWGSHAQKKGRNINTHKHLVLSAPHPSPLSAHRGFLTCQHFSKANAYLQSHNKDTIHWHLKRI